MKDLFNQPLTVGDSVAFVPNGYRNLVLGKISGFTARQVRIDYTNTWNHGSPGRPDNTLRYSSVIIRAPGDLAVSG